MRSSPRFREINMRPRVVALTHGASLIFKPPRSTPTYLVIQTNMH